MNRLGRQRPRCARLQEFWLRGKLLSRRIRVVRPRNGMEGRRQGGVSSGKLLHEILDRFTFGIDWRGLPGRLFRVPLCIRRLRRGRLALRAA